MMLTRHSVPWIFAFAICSWIRCGNLAFAFQTEQSHQYDVRSPAQIVPGGPSKKLSLTDIETEERARKRERRRGFGMPGGTGATSDRIHFSVPQVDVDETDATVVEVARKEIPERKKRSRWFVVLGNSTGCLDTSVSLPNKGPLNAPMALGIAAEAAFQVNTSEKEDAEGTHDSNALKVKQLASLLKVPIASARRMIRRVPALAGMNFTGTLSRRCIDMSVLLRCTPTQFTAVVKRYPSILTFRAETMGAKLVQLDCLLSGVSIENSTIAFDVKSLPSKEVTVLDETQKNCILSEFIQVNVSDSTLSIARRVPELLGSDIPGTLAVRALALRQLLFFGDDPIGWPQRDDEDQAFARLLRRCPELLLYNIEATVAPKVNQLNSLLASFNNSLTDEELQQSAKNRNLGTRIVLREPRLLLYDINKSLLPKAQLWRERVDDEASFNALLVRYPTLLMYSAGAVARLEYFAYRNRRKPDASEARQLLTLSKKSVESWGKHGDCLFDSTPALLGGTVSRRGRPRTGESTLEAAERREQRRAAQSHLPQQLEEMKVNELRRLLRMNGGKPSSKRKAQLVSELRALGFSCHPNVSSSYPHTSKVAQANGMESEHYLSYQQWMTMKLCYPYLDFLGVCNSVNNGRSSLAQCEETIAAGDLEKFYGISLKESVMTKNWA